MATFNNGESGLSVRTKINNVLRHADGTASELVINETGADVNFRVESDTVPNALFVDGGTGRVGIGTASPSELLTISRTTGNQDDPDAISLGSSFSNTPGSPSRLKLKVYDGGGDDANGLGHSAALMTIVSGLAFHNMAFYTNSGAGSTERLRITSAGDVVINKTTATSTGNGHYFTATGAAGHTRTSEPPLILTRDGTDGDIALFRKGGSTVGSISVTASDTTYNTTSDYRLKEDVQSMTGASDRVLALNPVNFAWKATGARTDGFIAHEAQAVAPYAVTGEKDGEEMQQIDQSKLVPLLTAALQEAIIKIEALEARVAQLEGN